MSDSPSPPSAWGLPARPSLLAATAVAAVLGPAPPDEAALGCAMSADAGSTALFGALSAAQLATSALPPAPPSGRPGLGSLEWMGCPLSLSLRPWNHCHSIRVATPRQQCPTKSAGKQQRHATDSTGPPARAGPVVAQTHRRRRAQSRKLARQLHSRQLQYPATLGDAMARMHRAGTSSNNNLNAVSDHHGTHDVPSTHTVVKWSTPTSKVS